ncbi:MAG TPA: division/cell wall cluster transcriptional repressor MraZ [Lachnospiraceae bacterium]|nr:division/cell wall cluster transcriptional repressor MraZ [Lachnospiraceae bacterium]MDD7664700.1 division/cell wall cluster transcriptional repressor MraZ [Lachnospiraceae bacterium]MDY4164391.1 division/cell wall cluster transcriptional repressor MraZ [Lachnospiraceae bacterium]HAP03218.1 division/cell wall cluster transcriptional repressor MraZ [Lachnospiraceae bacterium]
MFMGEYNHTIDPKGRVIIPAKFRENLGSQFVITKGLDGCLYGYPYDTWEEVGKNFQESMKANKEARKFSRFFFASASSCDIDKQGRILIPANLRDYAGLKKDVVLAGNLTHIEIWDKDKWDADNTFEDMDDVADKLAEIGLTL